MVRCDLLGRGLLLGVDGPEVLLGETRVACEVRERALARDERALVGRKARELGEELVVHRLQFALVGRPVGGVVVGVRRVELAERRDHVVDVALHVERRHPRVRVRVALGGALGDRQRLRRPR